MITGAEVSQPLHCSFCGTPDAQVRKLVAGPGVYICDQCVQLCNEIIGSVLAAPEIPATSPAATPQVPAPPQIPMWQSMSDDQMLERLPRIAAVGAQAEASLQSWVGHLRARGMTWARIGTALGMTRQSAWERFSGEE